MQSEDRYNSLFQYYGEKSNVPWRLLKAQARAESNFNPKAISHVGAKGLAQFMDPTWEEWGEGDPFNPEQSIKAQARYMRWLLERFDGQESQIEKALASYNWGIGNVRKMTEWMPSELPRGVWLYVTKILRLFAGYQGKTVRVGEEG